MNTTHQAVEAARRFHETYERLAPQFGYTTRPETREFDPESPNGKLMIAVCASLTLPQEVAAEVERHIQKALDCFKEIIAQDDQHAHTARVGLDAVRAIRAASRSPAPAGVRHTGDNDVDTATLLDESAEMLEEFAVHKKSLGYDTAAAGADAHAYRLRNLAVIEPAGVAGGVDASKLGKLRRAIECLEILNQRPRPMCRDCADSRFEGICDNGGLDCDMATLIADAKATLAALAATQAQPSPHPAVGGSGGVPVGEELALFRATLEGFADCGETDTDYSKLMDWAGRGLLECTNFRPTAAAHQILDAQRPTQPLTIYLDEDAIDVAQFYRAKGFESLPSTPTMTGAEIRACGWKKNNYPMFIDFGNTGKPFEPVGEASAVPLVDGMRFVCIPLAYAIPELDLSNPAPAGTLNSEPLVRLSDARAAIQQAAGAVPEGHRIVPIEPTEEMLAAIRHKPHPTRPDGWDARHATIYRAMLAASPTPPAGGSSDHLAPCAGGGVTQPLTDDFDLRGLLASKLTCWHRLTTAEVDNLLAFVRVQRPLTEDQAIQLVDEFAFEVGRSTVAIIEDLDKMHPEAIAIKQAFNRRHAALVDALVAPRPDAPKGQIKELSSNGGREGV